MTIKALPNGLLEERKLIITGMADGDPFNPRYFSVPVWTDISKEEALALAVKLFGSKYTTVTETITTRDTVRG